ncbi:hypothetical protein E3N88_23783 [Mikania micrantha]|uniref:Reverse transcriptase Ty1/copia-type domain-containing protein n=1 Tax=Mikania micrantha TaxID=192012 RepID=A0A5N6NEA8_9ASTR|nr:hypothetical protein E3N88_23783 [Mikania micrantha]
MASLLVTTFIRRLAQVGCVMRVWARRWHDEAKWPITVKGSGWRNQKELLGVGMKQHGTSRLKLCQQGNIGANQASLRRLSKARKKQHQHRNRGPTSSSPAQQNSEVSDAELEWSSPESTVKGRGPILPREPSDKDGDQDPTIALDERFDDTPLREASLEHEVYNKAFQPELLLLEGEPTTYKDAKGKREWEEAMAAEIAAIEKNQIWVLIERPAGITPIGLKWVYKVKRDETGKITRNKARLVAKGYVQQYGIDFEEVFAPVARMETIRLLLAIAAQRNWWVHHLDVKSAFLHGELKELVYVTQPEGFVKRGAEQKVYKLSKALYGLKQAPRAWNIKLDGVLKELGFIKCKHEHAVYRKGSDEDTLIIGVYVDDLLITGGCPKKIKEVKKRMEEKFEMIDLGLLSYYLGIQVTQNNQGIIIQQANYAKKILKEAGLSDCNPTKYPMEPGLKLSKSDEGEEADATTFRKWVGCLRYLTHTRPDLNYAVGYVSRFMQAPKQTHVQALKQILRYVKGSTDLGLVYQRKGSQELHGYSDSSHSTDKDDGRSTTGLIFFYGSGPVAWVSQKQTTVALSSCEAEFMAATAAACEAIWLRGLLSEITGLKEEQVEIKVDNKSAIALIKNPVFHGRSKHIDTRYHFIRECEEKGQLRIKYVCGEEQKADILTKALPRLKFAEMKIKIGLKEITSLGG